MSNRQAVLQNNSSHLPDLVGLCLAAVTLKIDSLLDTRFAEEMVASADAGFKSQGFKQGAQVVETNAGIGGPAQQPFEGFSRAYGAILTCKASERSEEGHEEK
jgi:hypothetical protein